MVRNSIRFFCYLLLVAVPAWPSVIAVQEDTGSKPGTGLEGALSHISPEDMKKILAYLASDELEGRAAGFPGNDKATEFIATHFKEAGLKPVGDDQTYFQRFTFNNGSLKTRNCIGVLEGTDPALKKEVVILGAHHDHVGKKGQKTSGKKGEATSEDQVWNGADDNGSGTTTVLTVANAFGKSGLKTKRTLVFMTFSAEEWGLIGSAHYVKNPVYPLSDTVAMLNMDMVGRSGGRAVSVSGTGTAKDNALDKIIREAAEKTGLKATYTPGITTGASDHASFYKAKIPSVFFFAGMHKDYHMISDHYDKIDYDTMARIARTAVIVLKSVGDLDPRLEFNSSGGKKK